MAIPVGHALAADVNVVTLDPSAQRNALEEAIAAGNAPEMERLCADPNVDVAALNIPRSPVGLVTDGPTLLSLCAGKPELAGLLVRAGARPDAGNREERTALHVAAEQGDATFLEELLSAEELDVDIRDCQGRTPLYHAISAYTGKFNTLKLLLDRGADANAPVDDDETPLHFLTRLFTYGGTSLDTYKKYVDELLAKGAMVDGTSDTKETALCTLVKASSPSSGICSDGLQEACVKAALYLLEKGARPDLLMKEQEPALWGKLSPLHLATNENCPIKILEAMLRVPDVNVNICSPEGIRPIAHAALKGNLPAVESLWVADAYIDGKGQKLMCTPLHHAAGEGHADIVAYLIERGAKLDADLEWDDGDEHFENQQLTPLALAVREGKKEAALALLNAGANFDVCPEGEPLICSAAPEIAIELVKRGGDIHATYEGKTLAHAAAGSGNVELMRALLEKDASLVDSKTKEGDTPLHIAVSRLNPELVRLLLSYSADPFAPNKEGNTPLHHAAGVHTCHDETLRNAVLQALISAPEPVEVQERGEGIVSRMGTALWGAFGYDNSSSHTAAPLAKNKEENTALDLATAMSAKNAEGKTPLHIACEKQNEVAVSVLLDKCPSIRYDPEAGYPFDCLAINTSPHPWGYGSYARGQKLWENRRQKILTRFSNYLLKESNRTDVPPLHAVCLTNSEQGRRVYQLLDEGEIDVNGKNERGQTALHWAARFGSHASWDKLLERSAQWDIKDCNRNTPIDLTYAPTDLQSSSWESHIAKVWTARVKQAQLLNEPSVQGSATVSKEEYREEVEHEHKAIVALLERVAVEKYRLPRKLSVRDSSTIQNEKYRKEVEHAHARFSTTLHQRCEKGEDISECLSYAQAVNALDSSGRTPLHWACQKGVVGNVRKLLSVSGIRLDPEDIGGHTPLTLAKHFQHKEIVALLEDAASAAHPQGGSPSAASEPLVATTEDAASLDSDGENSPAASIQSDVSPVESSSSHAALSGVGAMVEVVEASAIASSGINVTVEPPVATTEDTASPDF